MATRIKLRRDTAANWLEQNPILALGEPGFETDTRMMKMGDGSTAWMDLKYAITGDLQITNDTVHGDTGVSLSSGIGNRENWILLTTANEGDFGSPQSANPTGVAYDSQGNMFTSGTYAGTSGSYLQKISPSGEVIWNNFYDEYSSYGFGMSIDKFDNIILILGESDSSSDDIVLVKLSGDDGSILWQKYLNSFGDYQDYASCIDTDDQGNIFITGNSNSAGPNNNDAAYIAKFSPAGALLWSKQYNVDGLSSYGTGLTADKDGNLAIIGSTNNNGNFVDVYKIDGSNGGILWQGKILNVKFDKGNNDGQIADDIHFANIQSSDITSDSQGNFYCTLSWLSPYYPGGMSLVAKFDGTTGKNIWMRHINFDDLFQSVGSVICDELNNVYVSSTLYKNKNNFDQGNSSRLSQHIVKINPTGSIVWQRWLTNEQAQNIDGKSFSFGPFTGGQSIRVNKDYVAVTGSYIPVQSYSNNQNWYNVPYAAQLNRDGKEFNISGWKFVDSSKEVPSNFASAINDDNNWEYDPAEVLNFNFDISQGTVGYSMNPDSTELTYINQTNVHKVTFAEKTLSLPKGGSIDISRESQGYITAIGSFDGVEGGNTNGAVWLNGSARDDKGSTYSAGGWFTYDTWNNWDSYENIPMVFKTDADGKLIWQAGNALDQSWSAPDLVDVVYHKDTNTVVALGNDGELDGHEGFNILYLDADTGSMKQDITHIRPAEGSNDIDPRTLDIMSDGSPVVAGYITSSNATYADVTAAGAGLAGSGNGTLVILKNKFTVGDSTEYPKEDGTWYLYPDGAQITSVNRFGYDEAYPTITYTGTLGSAATVDVVIAGGNVSSVAINNAGSGYKPGHKLVILGTVLGGVDGTNNLSVFVDAVDGNGAITALANNYETGTLIDGTYTGVATTAVQGLTISAWAQYAPDADVYTLNIDNGGQDWGIGDTFKILGTALGGATPANDLTFTVTNTNGNGLGLGGVTEFSIAGTPQSTNIKLHAGSADYTQAGTYNITHELGTDSFIWTPMWSKVFGSATNGTNVYDDLHGMTVDSSDNVIVSGYSDDTGLVGTWNNGGWSQTGIITKFSSEGERLWTKSIDGSEGFSTVWGVATDADDNIYSVMSSGSGNNDPYITKLTPDGDFVWQQSIQINNSDVWSIDVADNGDVLIVGEVGHYWFYNDRMQGNNNIAIIKFDKDGNKLFTRTVWSQNGIHFNNNAYYSNQLTIKGDRFSFVGYSNDPGYDSHQGIVVDLPLDGSGTGAYDDFYYDEVESNYNFRWTRNNENNFNKVTDVTSAMAVRPYTFVDAPYVDDNAWRNISIYGDRTVKTYPMYKSEGGEVKGIAKITFEDGSVQTSSMQGLPQVDISRVNSGGNDYWLRPEDNGSHLLKLWNTAAIIPSYNRQYLPIGYAVTIITQSNVSGVVCENNDDSIMISGGNGSTYYSVTIPAWTMATLVKIAGSPGNSGTWMIAGAGITNGY
jgi:Major tropism determinant N-terminal domain/Beta-propeller repeat